MPRRITYAAPPNFPVDQRAAQMGESITRLAAGIGGILQRKRDESNQIASQDFGAELERITSANLAPDGTFNREAAEQAANQYAARLSDPLLRADFMGRAEQRILRIQQDAQARQYQQERADRMTIDDAYAQGYVMRGAAANEDILREQFRQLPEGGSPLRLWDENRQRAARFMQDNSSVLTRPEHQALAITAFDKVFARVESEVEEERRLDRIASATQHMALAAADIPVNGGTIEMSHRSIIDIQTALRDAGASRRYISAQTQVAVDLMLDTAEKAGRLEALDHITLLNRRLHPDDQLPGIESRIAQTRSAIQVKWANATMKSASDEIEGTRTLEELREVAAKVEGRLAGDDTAGYRGAWADEDTKKLESMFLDRQQEIIETSGKRLLKDIDDAIKNPESASLVDQALRRSNELTKLLNDGHLTVTLLDGTQVPVVEPGELRVRQELLAFQAEKFRSAHGATQRVRDSFDRSQSLAQFDPADSAEARAATAWIDEQVNTGGLPLHEIASEFAVRTGFLPDEVVSRMARGVMQFGGPSAADDIQQNLAAIMRIKGTHGAIARKIEEQEPTVALLSTLSEMGRSPAALVAAHGAERVKLAMSLIDSVTYSTITEGADKKRIVPGSKARFLGVVLPLTGTTYKIPRQYLRALAVERLLEDMQSNPPPPEGADDKAMDRWLEKVVKPAAEAALDKAAEEVPTKFRKLSLYGRDIIIPKGAVDRNGRPMLAAFTSPKVDESRMNGEIARLVDDSGLALQTSMFRAGAHRRVLPDPDSLAARTDAKGRTRWQMRVLYHPVGAEAQEIGWITLRDELA